MEVPQQFMVDIINMAVVNGAVVLEYQECPHCREHTLGAHYWQEAVPCMHCGVKFASRVPRLPVAGEVTLEHMTAAIQTLIQQYSAGPLNRWSTATEWAKLPAETRVLITENLTAAVVAGLKQVENLAIGLAKMSSELRDVSNG